MVGIFARVDLLAGQADAEGVAGVDRGEEAKRVDAVVGEDGAGGRVDEEAGGEGDDQVAGGNAAVEDGLGFAAASSMWA